MSDPSHNAWCPRCGTLVRVNDEGYCGALECPSCSTETVTMEELAESIKRNEAWRRFAAGHWTREPAPADGFYLYRTAVKGSWLVELGWKEQGDPTAEPRVRWSVPLPALPDVPEEE